MPRGPIDSPFEDYATDPIKNNGKNGDGAKYDTYSGVAEGDSATSGVMGGLLTEIEGPTSGSGQEIE